MFLELVLIACAVAVATEAYMLPASKCHGLDLPVIKLNFDDLIHLGKWHIVYATENSAIENLDHAYHEVTPNTTTSYNMFTTFTFTDNSKTTFVSKLTYDGILTEEITDDNGNIVKAYDYPLLITKDRAGYYYRCTDNGSPGVDVDTRFIVHPQNATVSDEALQEIMELDKKYKFKGTMYKLPFKLA